MHRTRFLTSVALVALAASKDAGSSTAQERADAAPDLAAAQDAAALEEAVSRASKAEQSAAGHASAAKDDAASADRAAVLAGQKADLATEAADRAEKALERALKVGENVENDLNVLESLADGPEPFPSILEALESMDVRARDQGHSLLAVLNFAAKAAFGIDLSPEPVVMPVDEILPVNTTRV